MIFNLRDARDASVPPFAPRVPERSPCRRNLWSRNYPGVAGGWDPASSLPSSLSPYRPLAFSPPPQGLNHTYPLGEVLSSPSRLSSFLPPPSRTNPLVFVSSTSSSLLYGRGILKRVGPFAHNPPGLQPERIGPWKTDRLNTIASSSLLFHPLESCERKRRLLSTARCENTSVKKSRQARDFLPYNFQILDIKGIPFIPSREIIARARAGKLWVLFRHSSQLLVTMWEI